MSRLLPRAYAVAVAAFALWVAADALACHHRVALIDDWRILHGMLTEPLGGWLFSSQNGHRIPVTLGLLALDYRFLDGRMHLPVIASLACAALSVAVLWRCVLGGGGAAPLATPLVAFASFLLFWSNGQYNFLWGAAQGNLLATLWLSLALWAAIRYAEGRAGAGPGWLVAAAGAALLATFAHGAGVAVWASLLAICAVARLGWRPAAAFAAGAVLAVVLYRLGAHVSLSPSSAASYLLAHPLEAIRFSAAFVGMAAGSVARGLGLAGPGAGDGVSALAGLAGLALFALHAAPRVRGRVRPSTLDLLATGLMAAVIAVAALLCITRLSWLAPEQLLAARFLNWSALFWMGLGLAVPGLIGPLALRRRAPAAAAGLAFAISLLALPAYSRALEEHLELRERIAISGLTLLLGIRDERHARVLSRTRSELVEPVAERMRRDGANLFADPRRALPGTPLSSHYAVAPDACRGSMRVSPGPVEGEHRHASAVGSVGDAEGSRPPLHVVIADEAGVIRGFGNVSASRRTRLGATWVGFIPDYDEGERYTAYGVLDERSACAFASDAAPRAER